MILKQDVALELEQLVPMHPDADEPAVSASRGTETVSVLFTDIVGSTALFERLGHGASETLIARHFATLHGAIATTGGEEVKRLGDGVMAAFRSARAATSCAEAMQQAIDLDNRRRGRDPVALRIGIDVGEVMRKDDDCTGRAATVAKRLCDHAAGGHVLASALVRDLDGGDTFKPIEQFELKGLDGPIAACELRWVPLAAEALLPTALTYRNAGAFVGHEAAHDRLREAWAQARYGERRVALLSGEPGIGKTRIAAELALEAAGHGALVLYGRCDREPLLAYQPFSEALRGHVAVTPPARLHAELERTGPELVRLAPELAAAGISMAATRQRTAGKRAVSPIRVARGVPGDAVRRGSRDARARRPALGRPAHADALRALCGRACSASSYCSAPTAMSTPGTRSQLSSGTCARTILPSCTCRSTG